MLQQAQSLLAAPAMLWVVVQVIVERDTEKVLPMPGMALSCFISAP